MDEPLLQSVILLIWLGASVLVGRTAVSYQRSAAAWFVLALVFSPFVAWVFLFVADVPHAAVVFQEKKERARELHSDEADLHTIAISETQCTNCGATVNPATREGLHSSENEPWLLVCSNCQAAIEPNI